MDLLAIVSAQFLFLLLRPGSYWFLDVALSILAADHKADLSRGVGWNGSVCVFGDWEDLLAIFLELGNKLEMEPLVLSCQKRLVGNVKFPPLLCQRWIVIAAAREFDKNMSTVLGWEGAYNLVW